MKCTAPQYVDFVMSSVQKLVTDEDVFPTKYGAWPLPPQALGPAASTTLPPPMAGPSRSPCREGGACSCRAAPPAVYSPEQARRGPRPILSCRGQHLADKRCPSPGSPLLCGPGHRERPGRLSRLQAMRGGVAGPSSQRHPVQLGEQPPSRPRPGCWVTQVLRWAAP